MPNPLSPNVHWNSDEEFDFGHLEGGRMSMTHEVANKGAVVGDGFCSDAVANASGLYDRIVGSHRVDKADEPVV